MISIPSGFNGLTAVLRLVTVISDALLNLLFNKPSAIAVPRFPPPIMAIFIIQVFYKDKWLIADYAD
jgi:hypothetical protein